MTFGKYLKRIRKEAGLTQKEISIILGYTSPQFVSNAERDVSFLPIKDLKKLCKAYKCEYRDIAHKYRAAITHRYFLKKSKELGI